MTLDYNGFSSLDENRYFLVVGTCNHYKQKLNRELELIKQLLVRENYRIKFPRNPAEKVSPKMTSSDDTVTVFFCIAYYII